MRTVLKLMILGFLVSACGEQFRGDFVGDAYSEPSDCGVDLGNQAYDIRLAGQISGNRANLRVIELKPKGSQSYSNSNAAQFARLFRGFEIKADVINDETISSSGRDTVYRVENRLDRTLENIDDNGEFVDEVTDEFDIVLTTGSVNRSRDEITSLEIERRTLVPFATTGELRECSFRLFAPQLTLEK